MGAQANEIAAEATEDGRSAPEESSRLSERAAKREKVFLKILQRPGIQPQKLVAETGYARSTVRYHVRMLHKEGKVLVFQEAKNAFVYPTDFVASSRRFHELEALPDPLDQAILGFLRMFPGSTQKKIAASLGIHPTTMCRKASALVKRRILRVERAKANSLKYFPGREGSPFEVMVL